MVKQLMHDPVFLSRKSETATAADLCVVRDLLDTLAAHQDTCVGMAANMIGENKRIIAFDNGGSYMVMWHGHPRLGGGAHEVGGGQWNQQGTESF